MYVVPTFLHASCRSNMLLDMEQVQSSMAQVSDQAKTLGSCIARLQGLTITLRRQRQTVHSTAAAALAAGDLSPSDKTLVLQLVLRHVAEQLPELLGSSPLLTGLPNVGRVASALGGLVGLGGRAGTGGLVGLGSRAGAGLADCSSRQLMGGTDGLASDLLLQQRSNSAGAGLGDGHIPVLEMGEPWPEGKHPAAVVPDQLANQNPEHGLAQAAAGRQLKCQSTSITAPFPLVNPAATGAAGRGGAGSGGGDRPAAVAASGICGVVAPATAENPADAAVEGVDEDWGSWGWVGECQRRSRRSSLCARYIPWLSGVRSAKSLDLKG